ncbi:helix-turn-helix domain-containing protein [Hymenobacter sp.]|uniref:winged helix-turn-helix transcriptional regulator n=1 Tax=Hymenobacter sp. TaxID=1898978 RepID=UPI00286B6FFD|nr:helix-turn-helix domain-containing protein [Hymenobacter sp.]
MNLTLELFGDKWSLLIIRDIMFNGKRHFRELLQSEEKIASNILTDRLGKLELEGIITKGPDPDHKQKHIYRLTPAGIDLLPLLTEIGAWSIKHRRVPVELYPHALQLVQGGAQVQAAVRAELNARHLGSPAESLPLVKPQ